MSVTGYRKPPVAARQTSHAIVRAALVALRQRHPDLGAAPSLETSIAVAIADGMRVRFLPFPEPVEDGGGVVVGGPTAAPLLVVDARLPREQATAFVLLGVAMATLARRDEGGRRVRRLMRAVGGDKATWTRTVEELALACLLGADLFALCIAGGFTAARWAAEIAATLPMIAAADPRAAGP